MPSVATTSDVIPPRPDGGRWPFLLISNAGFVYADSLIDLVGHVIPGYEDVEDSYEGDVQAFILRVEAAAQIATIVQALAVRGADEDPESGFTVADASEDVLTALFSPRGVAVLPFTGVWEEEVPLVLVSADYRPYTSTELPSGNVAFIDPTDDRLFLESLEGVGFIEVRMDADSDSLAA